MLSVGQGAGQLFTEQPIPQQLPQPNLPRYRRLCLCLSLLLEGSTGLSHSLGLATACPWLVSSGLVPPAPLCSRVESEEPAQSGPGGRGRGYRESPTQPVPNACPHEASTNRTSFFVVI